MLVISGGFDGYSKLGIETDAMSFPINRANWSSASQRTTGHYDDRATEYEGIRWQCLVCTRSFTFTAEEQQVAYEVEKRFVWYLPNRCKECSTRAAA